MSWVPKNNLAHGANYRGQPPESRVTGVLNRIASLWIPSSTCFWYVTGACIAWGWPGRDQQGRSAMIQQCHISTLEPPYQSDSCKHLPHARGSVFDPPSFSADIKQPDACWVSSLLFARIAKIHVNELQSLTSKWNLIKGSNAEENLGWHQQLKEKKTLLVLTRIKTPS